MSAASDFEISELDRSLAIDGQDVILRSLAGTGVSPIPFDVKCRAWVKNLSADELVGTIKQDTSEVILSPTEIIRSGWPGPWVATPAVSVRPATDRRVPTAGAKCVIQGKPRAIDVALPVYVDGELVRIKLRVQG